MLSLVSSRNGRGFGFMENCEPFGSFLVRETGKSDLLGVLFYDRATLLYFVAELNNNNNNAFITYINSIMYSLFFDRKLKDDCTRAKSYVEYVLSR